VREFKKILVANRGEIALRVLNAAKELSIRTVVVYSEADKDSLPVQAADESYLLKGQEVSETYLDIPQILATAKAAQADAVHPGYGFLSENAEFARQCGDSGIVFIGPNPETIVQLGDKVASKKLALKAKVPVIPGYEKELPGPDELKKIAKKIGYPLLVKAAAGGGGKGMRLVQSEDELSEAIEIARREGLAYFNNDRIFLEKYIQNPRHVEVQILGDEKGQVLHLFERECSVQRRHQKMIEESPSPSISEKTRKALGEAAVRLAKAAAYSSLGTVEFLLDPKDNFYFLEVNTRLQVEHPITEMVTGIDLVKAQIKIAEGHRLPFGQNDLFQRGHAVECRLYAEDPENNFLPSEGVVGILREPSRPGVRLDSALQEGQNILSLYDPLLAKLIVYGANRKEALIKMNSLLRDYTLLGLRHNLDFLRYIINSYSFVKGQYHTHTVQELIGEFLTRRKEVSEFPSAALAIGVLAQKSTVIPKTSGSLGLRNSLEELKGFRNA